MPEPVHTDPAPIKGLNLDVAEGSGAPSPIRLANIGWSLLLSLSVLLVIGYFTFDLAAFRQMLVALNPWLLTGAFAMVGLRILFGGWRLSYISGDSLSFMAGLRAQLAWDFSSNITPSLVGGAPLAAVYISHDSKVGHGKPITVGDATALMTFVMVLDQIWFALSVPFVLVMAMYIEVIPASLGKVGLWTSVAYFLGFMVWTTIFTYATLVRPDLLVGIADRICRLRLLRRFREPVAKEMRQFQKRAYILRAKPARFFFHGMLLTVGTWMARYLLMVFVVWSVYAELDKFLFFMRSAALTLGSLILPTPGGAGGIEGLYAVFLGPLMPKALVVPTLLLWRTLAYYIFLAFGVFLSTHHVQKTLRHKKHQALPLTGNPPLSRLPADILSSETVENEG